VGSTTAQPSTAWGHRAAQVLAKQNGLRSDVSTQCFARSVRAACPAAGGVDLTIVEREETINCSFQGLRIIRITFFWAALGLGFARVSLRSLSSPEDHKRRSNDSNHHSGFKMKRQLDSESRDISPPPTAKKATTSKSEGALPLLSRRGLTPAISSFFTPLSQKKASNIKIEWQVHDRTLLIGKYRSSSYLCSPTKIAAFDLVLIHFSAGGS